MADQYSKSWNVKHYIVAALGGALAATAVIIIVSAILSPARVHFSVTHAWRNTSGDTTKLHLTVAANNTSQQRAAAKYQSIFLDVNNSTTAGALYTTHADIETVLPTPYLPPEPNVLSINASVLLMGDDLVRGFTGLIDSNGLTVVVTAQVRFKIGVARTRLYDIKVSCSGVHFPEIEKSSNASASIIPCK